MLKLGVALNALGARDQACATFAELERKFPQAAPNVRQGVERERTRARCAALMSRRPMRRVRGSSAHAA